MSGKNFYRKKAEQIVEKCINNFDYIKVYISSNSSIEAEVLNTNVESCSLSEGVSLAVVASKEGRTASVSSSDLSDDSVETLIKSLLELITIIEPDPYYVVPDKNDLGKATVSLDRYDNSFFKITPDILIADAIELEKIALNKDKRLFSSGAYVGAGQSLNAFACSYGFSAETSGTYFYKGVWLAVDDNLKQSENKGRKQRNGWSTTNVFANLLKSNEFVANEASKRVLSRIGAVKPPTGVLPVIFDNQTAKSFVSAVVSAATGSNIYRKESFLVDKLGEKIASDNLTIIENPLLRQGLGSRLFDSDGVRSRIFPVLEKGVLKNYLLSVYSANRLGLQTTGSAGGYSNLVVEKGEKNLQQLVKTIDKGILVTSLMGQGANIKTGDYSKGAEGFLIENGEITQPVNEFTVSSTFGEMLENIEEIGNDVDYESSVLSPSIKFSKITVGGN
jgi:PmbA protein